MKKKLLNLIKIKKRKLKNENDFEKDEDGNMMELGENLI